MALAPGSTAAGGNSSDGSGTIPSSQAPGGSSGGGDSSDGSSNAIGSSQGSSGSADETGGDGGREGAVGDGLAGEGMAGTGVAGTGITGQEGAGQLGLGDGVAGEAEDGGLGGQGQPTTSADEEQLPAGWCRAECIVDQRARHWANASGSGQSLQYRVRFAGHGPEADEWIKATRVSLPLLAAWESRQQGLAAGGSVEAPASVGGAQAPGMAGNPAPAAARSAGAGTGDGGAASRRSRRLQEAALASQ